MAFKKHLDQVRRMHTLIKFKRTGTPQQFAERLGVSQSQLYRLLSELKSMGAPIHFCMLRQSYAYYENVELRLGYFKNDSPGEAVVRSLEINNEREKLTLRA